MSVAAPRLAGLVGNAPQLLLLVHMHAHSVTSAALPVVKSAALPVHLFAGLVETSTNLASIKPQPAEGGQAVFAVQCSTRSSLMPALEQVGRWGRLRKWAQITVRGRAEVGLQQPNARAGAGGKGVG